MNIQGTLAISEQIEELTNLWYSFLRMRKNAQAYSETWPPMIDKHAWPGAYRTVRHSCRTKGELKSIGDLVDAEDPWIRVEGIRYRHLDVKVGELFEEPPPYPDVPEEILLDHLRTDGIEPDLFHLYVRAASSSDLGEDLLDFSLVETLLFSDIFGIPYAYTVRSGQHRPVLDSPWQNKSLVVYPTTTEEVAIVGAGFDKAYQRHRRRWTGILYSRPFEKEMQDQ